MKNKSQNSGLTFSGLLTIVFIVLKLTKVINWSWFWILSPIWVPIILGILIVVVYYIFKCR